MFIFLGIRTGKTTERSQNKTLSIGEAFRTGFVSAGNISGRSL